MVANLVFGCTLSILIIINFTNAINLGLFAGDKKHLGGPLTIKKTSHKSPVFININTLPILPFKAPKLSETSLPKLKLPKSSLYPSVLKLPKPPPLSSSLKKLKSPFFSLMPTSLFPKPLLVPPLIPKFPLIPPLIPKVPLVPILPTKLPLLPIFPTILPPPLPLLPILPPPLLPILPPLLSLKALELKRLLKAPPLKTPRIISLASEIKPVIVPHKDDDILAKLRQLKKQGSLTKIEFCKFKKLLLRK